METEPLSGLVIILITVLKTALSNSCAEFHFPTINGSSLTVLEGTNLSIPFTINYTEDCTPAENFSLRVTRIAGNGEAEPQCSLRHRHKNCLNTAGPSKCTCPSGGKPYQLIHRFDRSDSLPTEWVWSVDDNHTDERRIHFEVCSLIISPADHFDIQPGATNIQLNVQTHSTEFPRCALQRQASKMACSVTNIKGTPPDLVLTVRLDNVGQQDEGQWTLTLTNDVGKGHLDISLTFTEISTEHSTISSAHPNPPSTETNKVNESERTNSDPQTWVMAFAAAVAVAVVVVVIAVCRECRRKSGLNAAHDLPAEGLAMRERENVAHEEHGSRQSAHYYMEVPDSPPPSDESSVAEEPPPLPCHGPGNAPEDYLNPEPSREETEEEGTEWKTVPFYENTQISNVEPRVLRELSRVEAQASNSNSCIDVMASVHSLDGGNSASADVPQTENSSAESEEGYVPYAPQVYENTMP